MKILRVISSMNPATGGPAQGIRNIIPELKKLNIENEVVVLDNPEAVYIGKDDFIIHLLGNGRGPWAYNAALLTWLKDNISKYDILIIHGLWQYHTYAVYKALKYLKTHNKMMPKVYAMPHGMLDPYFQHAPDRKLKAIRNWLYWKLVEGKVINNIDGLLFTCQEEMILARETFRPYHPKSELNIGYGINPPPPFRTEMNEVFLKLCPQVRGQKYLLYLSRIHIKKGVDNLIKAYLSIIEKGFENIPKLVIAGPGIDSPYGKMITKIVNSYPVLKQNVFFPGMLRGDAKWGAFYNCEVFILPSHQENFGIAVVEALACEKPVLISTQINIWKEIEQHNAGIIEKDTIEGTQKLLLKWLNMDIVSRKRMAQNAQNCFFSNFTMEYAAKKMYQILNN